jgi:hypothetical protein
MGRPAELFAWGRPISGTFGLLRPNENGLTFALGYVLAKVPSIRVDLARHVGVPELGHATPCEIHLQNRGDDSITDLEIRAATKSVAIAFEAKRDEWPTHSQLAREARDLLRLGARRTVLVPLGRRDLTLFSAPRPIGNVTVAPLRWTDILHVLHHRAGRAQGGDRQLLLDLADRIRELLAMHHYDKEVLVRDLRDDTWTLFHDHGLYLSGPRERAEPLFFAPHRTDPKSRGVRYISRVYHRDVVRGAAGRTIEHALRAAIHALDARFEHRSKRKSRDAFLAWLDALKRRWKRGVSWARSRGLTHDEQAAFFLGPPVELREPLIKRAKRDVATGYSLTFEEAMGLLGNEFHC